VEGKSILLGTVAELQNVPEDTAASGDRFPPRDRLGVRFAAGHMLSIPLRDSSVDAITAGNCISVDATTAGICIHQAGRAEGGAAQ
jgi:hypothetical protein